jgi:hypothetical protein
MRKVKVATRERLSLIASLRLRDEGGRFLPGPVSQVGLALGIKPGEKAKVIYPTPNDPVYIFPSGKIIGRI